MNAQVNKGLLQDILLKLEDDPHGTAFLWADLTSPSGSPSLSQVCRRKLLEDARYLAQGISKSHPQDAAYRQMVVGVAVPEGYALLLCQLALLLSRKVYIPLDLVGIAGCMRNMYMVHG